MARGVNKVILVGNLGADPEIRYMPSGGAVANISIATTEKWLNKSSGEPEERTEWHQVTLFNKLGEIAGEYLKKGSQVYIEGSLRTDKYQDRDTGADRYATKVIARDMQLLGSAEASSERGEAVATTSADAEPANAPPATTKKSAKKTAAKKPAARKEPALAEGPEEDSDIPF